MTRSTIIASHNLEIIINIITDDAKGHKNTRHVEQNIVSVQHVTFNKATDANYQCDWTLDFTDVTVEEKEILASKHLVIQLRPHMKNAPASELEGLDTQTFLVRQYLDNARKASDPVSKARKALSALTPEEVKILLAE